MATTNLIKPADIHSLATTIARKIADAQRDPYTWGSALREVAERARLDVTRIDFVGPIYYVARRIVEEGQKHNRSHEDFA